MAENSKIEWTGKKRYYRKVGFNALTTEKVAAKKTGCDLRAISGNDDRPLPQDWKGQIRAMQSM